MTVHDLVGKFSHIRLADRSDNDAILEFFKTIPMKAQRLSIGFKRDPDYFALLDYQGDKSFVFIFENEDRSIGGVAVYSLGPRFINGKMERAAYLADLRLSPKLSRLTRVQWRKFYNDLVLNSHKISDFDHCRYLYSAILDENADAIQAFTKKRKDVVYRPMAQYNTVSILVRFPFFPQLGRRKSGPRVRRAEAGDETRLQEFLCQQNRIRPLGSTFGCASSEELARRLEVWKDLDLSSFIIAENNDGDIVGCFCPWSDTQARRVFIQNMSKSVQVLAKTLELLGKDRVSENSQLNILYLTHLEIALDRTEEERSLIFSSLLKYLFRQGLHKGYHLISFVDFNSASLLKALNRRSYLYWKTPGTIYQVLHRSHYTKENLIRPSKLPPSFEVAVL